MENKNINNKTKETKNMNPVTKYIIMALVAVGVTGGTILVFINTMKYKKRHSSKR